VFSVFFNANACDAAKKHKQVVDAGWATPPAWHNFREDPALDKLTDDQFPGSVLFSLRGGLRDSVPARVAPACRPFLVAQALREQHHRAAAAAVRTGGSASPHRRHQADARHRHKHRRHDDDDDNDNHGGADGGDDNDDITVAATAAPPAVDAVSATEVPRIGITDDGDDGDHGDNGGPSLEVCNVGVCVCVFLVSYRCHNSDYAAIGGARARCCPSVRSAGVIIPYGFYARCGGVAVAGDANRPTSRAAHSRSSCCAPSICCPVNKLACTGGNAHPATMRTRRQCAHGGNAHTATMRTRRPHLCAFFLCGS